MNSDIQQLFITYEHAFSALDVARQADLFADSFLSAGPRGVIAGSKAQFTQMAEQMATFYKGVGFSGARIVSMEEKPITVAFSLVDVRWEAVFRRQEEKYVQFDVSYIVQRTDTDPKIILFITHQDEQEGMKDLKLI
ncbi:hypothetical protein GQ464_009420 [Rhodocaloribacter litoris]|uniref:nuclear transport factor 2 family protein n=1 Tax=Rhodocaloribacter litoris TaxID=2558931 RepID=UPI001422AE6B|nr:nuclear transport factor 2 family protein [Rhodocaloribacter litoris]QXD13699.1 hypothetical protein GQ464_009420 [Rhodocaloribacter litoris]